MPALVKPFALCAFRISKRTPERERGSGTCWRCSGSDELYSRAGNGPKIREYYPVRDDAVHNISNLKAACEYWWTVNGNIGDVQLHLTTSLECLKDPDISYGAVVCRWKTLPAPTPSPFAASYPPTTGNTFASARLWETVEWCECKIVNIWSTD